MQLLVKLLINAIAVYTTAHILPGINIADFLTAVVTAVVIAAVNLIVKPILLFFTFPITLVTLGLFTLVINALLILLVDYLVPGFEVQSFIWALLFSLTLSLITSIINFISRR